MNNIQCRILLFYHSWQYRVKSWLLRIGCYFHSSWFHIDNASILTTGKVVKFDGIYTLKEDNDIEIVRLTNVHFERGYLYCSLFFFFRNKIITVRQTMLKGAPILWNLSDNKEFDELMSIKLWHDVNKGDELLEFDF
jgi:hypothetical protein